MIKWLSSPILCGVMFIVGGVLFLLENLGIFQASGLFWAFIFALGGIFFLTMSGGLRANWWAIIPGITLLGIALLISLAELIPGFNDDLGGVIVLGAIGTAFLLIFLTNRTYWWSLVPAGVMYSIAAMIVIDTFATGFDTGGIILLGLGVTFAILAVLPDLEADMRWAWIPALVLGLIGIFILAASTKIFGYLWPAALIFLGLFFVLRTVRSHS